MDKNKEVERDEEQSEEVGDNEAWQRTRENNWKQLSRGNKTINQTDEKGTIQETESCETRMNLERRLDETNNECVRMNENIGKVMTQTKLGLPDGMKYELNPADKAMATNEESSKNADKRESKGSEGHWLDWRNAVRLFTGVLSHKRVQGGE